MKKILTAFTFFLILSVTCVAQEDDDQNRKFGFTASIQAQQMDFLVPFWMNERFSIAPSISVTTAQEAGSDISLGVQPKSYLSDPFESVLFLSGRAGIIIGMPENGDNIYDFLIGAGFGAEYFFQPKFSVGIELQGNVTISDKGSFRFGNPGNINFNTATALTASIYF